MNPQQSERLLTNLQNSPLLEGWCLAVYPARKVADQETASRHLCGTRGIPHLCHKICDSTISGAIEDALASRKSVFFRCPLGLFSFAIPVSVDSCLVGSGMRENLFDLYFYGSEQFESLKEKQKIHPYEILEQLEKLPVTSEKNVRETMLKVERLIASFTTGERTEEIVSRANLQSTFGSVAGEIEKAESLNKAVSLFGETLGILFDIPVIALALKDEETDSCLIETCWGALSGPSEVTANNFPFQGESRLPITLERNEVKGLFPETDMTGAICLPLFDRNAILGMALLFNASLTSQEITLAELLTSKLVEKLKENRAKLENQRQQRNVRLLEMIRTLALTEKQEELLRLIMEMGAELADAANGSLMLIDKGGKNLRVASALGLNPILAQSLYTRMGEGISGRVAVSGAPLLIKDIERELDPGRKNRARFGTKSCLSLPLRFKGGTIGVLNLADKKNGTPFTVADQEILTTFLDQATIILERTTTLRKARLNTITDPLTGLYNLRFLKKRLSEELSRSIRHNLPMTLIMAGLDNLGAPGSDSGADPERVMKELAGVLTGTLREMDLIGRFDEKEFCIVLPATPLKEAVRVAERIKRLFAKELTKIGDYAGKAAIVTNIGIASFPENASSVDELLNVAGSALAKAESDGGNKICYSIT